MTFIYVEYPAAVLTDPVIIAPTLFLLSTIDTKRPLHFRITWQPVPFALIALIGTRIAWASIFGNVIKIFFYFDPVLRALREFEGKSLQFEDMPFRGPKRR